MMFTRMKLENFKSWQSLDIELAPLTILFGTNSSGKSSILQAILLLIQSAGLNYSVSFGGKKSDYVDLGGFRQVVYHHQLNKKILISIDVELGNQISDMGFSLQYENDDTKVLPTSPKSQKTLNIFGARAIEYDNFQYLGPIRQNPQRVYTWRGVIPTKIEPDGENTFMALIDSMRDTDSVLHKKVSEWLNKIEVAENLRIRAIDSINQYYEPSVTFGGTTSNLADVGFGVSQVLPVITMLFFAPEGSIILLEQPELHLHPRAQAHLADLMLEVAEERKLQLIVESHSEHLLRRLQRRIAEREYEFANPDNIKMYFCDMGKNGSTIQEVEVDEYGQIKNWPDKFFGDITGDLEAMTMAALKRSLNGKN